MHILLLVFFPTYDIFRDPVKECYLEAKDLIKDMVSILHSKIFTQNKNLDRFKKTCW